jgi:hypothetical protein
VLWLDAGLGSKDPAINLCFKMAKFVVVVRRCREYITRVENKFVPWSQKFEIRSGGQPQKEKSRKKENA